MRLAGFRLKIRAPTVRHQRKQGIRAPLNEMIGRNGASKTALSYLWNWVFPLSPYHSGFRRSMFCQQIRNATVPSMFARGGFPLP
jgi:hypothetical protein